MGRASWNRFVPRVASGGAAVVRDLSRLLSPRSIAVVGGGAWCANVVRECEKIGFEGAVWPVHPHRDSVGGRQSYRSVDDLPGVPDATFIGVNRVATLEVVRSLAARGAGGAVCFASGFAEAKAELSDGPGMQAVLLEAAGDMPVLGPNCYGLLNMVDGAALWPDHHGAAAVDRGVALITQSSNVAINLTMQRRALPVAFVVTLGNEAQTGLVEVGMAMVADPRVTALGLYLEGIGDLAGFERLARAARAAGKPIVALKVGASEQARQAAVSHTASLTGRAAGAAALFRRLGVGQVFSIGAMLEALKAVHVAGPLASNRIASMSCSGGEASLVADSALGTGVVFPPLNAVQRSGLAEALGPKVALANPLDYHTYIWADLEAMAATFTAMMEGDLALGMVVLDFPRADRCDATEWPLVIEAVARAGAASGKQMAIVASYPDTMPEDMAAAILARGILPLCGVPDALEALRVTIEMGRRWEEPAPLLLPTTPDDGRVLSEFEAKAHLAEYGLEVPQFTRAGSPEVAAEVAAQIGFPVVLKGDGLAHKSEAGAVVVGLDTAAAVERAAGSMSVAGYLVEEMVTGGLVELLIGITLDEAHGFLLTLGAGGVLTEVLSDTQCLLLPVTGEDVERALDGLAIAPVLNGYRGARGGSRAAVVASVLALQDYVVAHRERVLEVEVNPLIVTPDAAIAVDALIRVRKDDE